MKKKTVENVIAIVAEAESLGHELFDVRGKMLIFTPTDSAIEEAVADGWEQAHKQSDGTTVLPKADWLTATYNVASCLTEAHAQMEVVEKSSFEDYMNSEFANSGWKIRTGLRRDRWDRAVVQALAGYAM